MTNLEKEALFFKASLLRLKKDVAVRVESPADIDFWAGIFQLALPHLQPEFFPQAIQHPSVGTAGKTCVLLLKEFADKELVLCVDSDSDYLLEKPILNTPFIFHTYVDSIENYWSFANGLSEVVKKATKTADINFDFNDFFETYSKIIYPYLICSLFSSKLNDNLLTRQELGKNSGFIKIKNGKTDLTTLKRKLAQQFAAFNNQFKLNPIFKPFKERLTTLGLDEKNAYLFVRGHDILDRVAVPLMKFLGDDLATTHFSTLTTSEEKAEYYKHIQANIYDVAAQNNPKMSTCSFYQRIVQDIRVAFQN